MILQYQIKFHINCIITYNNEKILINFHARSICYLDFARVGGFHILINFHAGSRYKLLADKCRLRIIKHLRNGFGAVYTASQDIKG
jgi:hypothetical protein